MVVLNEQWPQQVAANPPSRSVWTARRGDDSKLLVVTLETVLPLRHAVLRPSQPAAAAVFPQDEMGKGLHVAAQKGQTIVAVASFYPEEEPSQQRPNSWRLRGMATAEAMRGQGHGARLLLYGIEQIMANGAAYVWCTARSGVTGFYNHLGFVSYGEPFEVAGIGEHMKMGCVLGH